MFEFAANHLMAAVVIGSFVVLATVPAVVDRIRKAAKR